MKRLLGSLLAVAMLAAAMEASTIPAWASTTPVYYVALGDSLATGAQSAPSGTPNALLAANGTNRGYVDDLYAIERAEIPNLQLRNFGCGGESTTSMIEGGFPFDIRCGYVADSQLDQAVAFLNAHQGQVAFITIDIGANDLPDGCDIFNDPACLQTAEASIQPNLPMILTAVRDAAGPDVPIVAMNYYDPFAGLWIFGQQQLALASKDLVVELNDTLEAIYQGAGSPVADVQTAFAVTDFANTAELPGFGTVPLSVYNACTLTWFCAGYFDVHANDEGYAVIAQAFEAVLPV